MIDSLFFVLISICLGTESTETSNDAPHARIWNGTKITLSDYGFLASLDMDRVIEGKLNTYICAGSVISREWILTAAHCLLNVIELTVNTKRNSTRALAFYLHPYHPKQMEDDHHDVGLIRIPVQENFHITLSLPTPGQDEQYIDTDRSVTMLGTGKVALVSHPEEEAALGLSKAVGKLSRFRCNIRDTFFNHDEGQRSEDRGQLCLRIESPPFYFTCPGDSGGPVIAGDATAAIVFALITTIDYGCTTQWVSRTNTSGSPIFTNFHRVSSEIAWLLMKIDSESRGPHALESTMDLWMTAVDMVSHFP